MTDTDQKIVEQLRKFYNYSDTTIVKELRGAVDLIESQAAENKRLRAAVPRLQHALEAIDCAIMPVDQREADTKTVGGPVSPYCVDYDEQGVVRRVQAFVEAQAAATKTGKPGAAYDLSTAPGFRHKPGEA